MSRPLLAWLGLAVLALAWGGPLPEAARGSFAAHMTMHMAVVAVAAPLLALGVAGGRLDPARRAPALFAALPASVVELAVVWTWHAPALHHAARGGAGALALEQGSFLLAGLLVWLAAFGGPPARRRGRAAAGVVGLLLTSMHMTLLGALLGLARRPAYAHSGGIPGLTPLQDQQLGGAIMLGVGGFVYLAGGLVLVARLLQGRDSERGAAAGPAPGVRAGGASGRSVRRAPRPGAPEARAERT